MLGQYYWSFYFKAMIWILEGLEEMLEPSSSTHRPGTPLYGQRHCQPRTAEMSEEGTLTSWDVWRRHLDALLSLGGACFLVVRGLSCLGFLEIWNVAKPSLFSPHRFLPSLLVQQIFATASGKPSWLRVETLPAPAYYTWLPTNPCQLLFWSQSCPNLLNKFINSCRICFVQASH